MIRQAMTLVFSVVAFALAPLGARASGSAPFDALVIFGDSLSDAGNAGRFSNGPVWVEGLAANLGLSARPSNAGGSNYAIGGARLDPTSGPTSLPAQLERYLTGESAETDGQVLYVVYGGGNDLLAAALGPGGEAILDRAVDALRRTLFMLADAGARHVLVPNLPDVGMTPAAREAAPSAINRARRLSEQFNTDLEEVLFEVEAASNLRVYRLDVWAMAERARHDPAAFGFTNVNTPCIGLPDCDGYLFWDNVHPTAAAHARLAEAAASVLAGP